MTHSKKIICQNFAEGRCREQGINILFFKCPRKLGDIDKLLLSPQEHTKSPNLKKIYFIYVYLSLGLLVDGALVIKLLKLVIP